MRVVFMGSDELALPALHRLLATEWCEVPLVVTQPDRPQGRKRRLAPCPVKQDAMERGVPVWTPEKVGSPTSVEKLRRERPDLFAVAAYGQFIPSQVLDLAPHGGINIHPSLLPRYRGASPIQWAVANGDAETGVTILYVSREMDAGDILLQERCPIDPEETAADLKPRLAERGADRLIEAILQLRNGTARPEPQDPAQVVTVSKLKKEEGRLDWRLPAEALRNRIRGFQPWPGCFCEWPPGGEGRLNVLKARVEADDGVPGQVLALEGDGPLIATGRAALRLLEVQPAGKKPMSGQSFLLGHPAGEARYFDVPGAE